MSAHYDFIKEYHSKFSDQEIYFEHIGNISQDTTKAFSKQLEERLESDGVNSKVIRKIYHAVVESLQNVMRHAHEVNSGSPQGSDASEGGFIISGSNMKLMVSTCNAIPNEDIDGIKSMIDRFNAMDETEIKEVYKQMVKEARISEKGGAGLGLIDMIKKTKNKIEYHFEKVNDNCSLIILTSSVDQID